MTAYLCTLIVAMGAAVSLLCGCAAGGTADHDPSMSADVPFSRGIEQRVDAGGAVFVHCDPCTPPTPKVRATSTRPQGPQVVATAGAATASPGAWTAAQVRPPKPAAESGTATNPAAAPLTLRPTHPSAPGSSAQPTTTPAATHRFILHFAFGSARLSADARAVVAQAALALRGASRVEVVGFTDDRGDVAVNHRVAAQRAVAAALSLMRERRRLTPDHNSSEIDPVIVTSGRALCCYVGLAGGASGVTKASAGKLASAGGQVDRATSRRVEIVVLYGADRAGAAAQAATGARTGRIEPTSGEPS